MQGKTKHHKGLRRLLLAGMACCTAVLLFALWQLFSIAQGYLAARQEYSTLQAYRPAPGGAPGQGDATFTAASPKALAEINEDYVGWLEIPGIGLSYPVVQGGDNAAYLHTTFSGEDNAAGAIFMDCESKGFYAPYNIVYGHNMRDGSMFGGLHQYLNADFLAENPALTVYTASGESLQYTIFAARRATADDEAYRLDYLRQTPASNEEFCAFAQRVGAGQGYYGILTLSTCGAAGGADRVLLHAAYAGT